MSTADPQQPEQKQTASTEPVEERAAASSFDDETAQEALEAVEEAQESAELVAREASAALDDVDESDFAEIESLLSELEAKEETAAVAPIDSPTEGMDDADTAFARTLEAMGDDAMAAPEDVAADPDESLPPTEPVNEPASPNGSADAHDVNLEESAPEELPPADLDLDDEIANQLDDLFQTDLNNLDDVLNDVFGPEHGGRAEASDKRREAAATTSAAPMTAPERAAPPDASPSKSAASSPPVESGDAPAATTGEEGDVIDLDTLDDADASLDGPSEIDDASSFAAPPAADEAPREDLNAPSSEHLNSRANEAGTLAASTAEQPTGASPPAPLVINATRRSAETESKSAVPVAEAVRLMLLVMNRPVQSLPESKRVLVNWFALTLALWVPIVWCAVWFLGRT